MKLPLLFSAVMILCSLNAKAQIAEHADHDGHDHEHHPNEIGISLAPVLFVEEEEFSYGIHAHYVRNFSHSNFGIGLGYERVFDEHKHNTIGLVFLYRFSEALSVNVSPGFAFEDHGDELHAAVHFETAYEFDVAGYHLGPTFEVALDEEDVHVSLGLHLGFGF